MITRLIGAAAAAGELPEPQALAATVGAGAVEPDGGAAKREARPEPRGGAATVAAGGGGGAGLPATGRGYHWTRRGRRGNGRRRHRALCYGRGREQRQPEDGDDWAGRGLCGDGAGPRWRRGHNRRRLARLRHHDTARRRSFDLGRGRRARRCGWRRCRAGRYWSRRCGRFDRCRRRSLRTRRGALCLFLTLLNRLKNIAGLGHPRPVDLLRCSVALRRGAEPPLRLPPRWKCARTRCASSASSELECVLASVTPTSRSTSRIALLLTSSSLAKSLMRTLLIRPFTWHSACRPSASHSNLLLCGFTCRPI